MPQSTLRLLFTLTFLLGFSLGAQAQLILSGRVTDSEGEGLPFAAVYKKNTTLGTTTNAEGYYTLRLAPGEHTVVFRFVGYRTAEISLNLQKDSERNIKVEADVVQLQAIEVVAGGEDPAYEVIRQAQAKRKDYLTEVSSYDCDVYIKGLQRLDKAPNAILGINLDLDTGIAYLSESVSKFSYQAPDKTKEIVVSSKVSGNNAAFSYNQATGMMISFYENTVEIEGLGERPFISPIASGAMLFYDYKLEGLVPKDGEMLNKIRVIPKRLGDPVFSGLIYIIEDSWRIHSLDLMLTKDAKINFIDSLQIEQQYAPVNQGPWMLFNQKFEFKLKALGFEGKGYFVGVHSNYELNPIHERGYFGSTTLKVEYGSNKKDSTYWSAVRPVPLTRIEKTDYQVKDSIQAVRESKPYLDSVDAITNRIKPAELFISGISWRNSFEKRSFYLSSLLSSLQFNTVEGFVLAPELTYRQDYEDSRYWRVGLEGRYGFSSKQFYPKISTLWYYNPKKFAYLAMSAGQTVQQYNSLREPIRPYINSFMSLVAGDNYMKLYEKTFLRVRHRGEIKPGLRLDLIFQYEDRTPLFNTTDFSLRDEPNYTANYPANRELGANLMPEHQAAEFQVTLRWVPFQKYIERPDERFSLYPEWPRFNLTYRQGIPSLLGSDVNYGIIDLNITHDVSLGLLGNIEWQVLAGKFLYADELYLPDLYHFNGNRTPFGRFNINYFELLDYYEWSTLDGFFKANYAHHFNGFIFNKLPLLRKLDLQAVGSINYLYTDAIGHYVEVGAGVEHIFKVLRVDYYWGFREGSPTTTGLRFGLGF